MRNIVAVSASLLLTSALVSGCLDWSWASPRKGGGASGGKVNSANALAMKKTIEGNLPEWSVFKSEEAIFAVPQSGELPDSQAGGLYVAFPAASGTSYDGHINGGAVSLVDYLGIAQAISDKSYRLPPWPDDMLAGSRRRSALLASEPTEADEGDDAGNEEESDPVLEARSDETGEVAEPVRRPGKTTNLARRVHDELVAYVAQHTTSASCRATCEGSYALCSKPGKRAFGRGVPCAVGSDSVPATFGKTYGNSWCTSAFCPALSQLAGEERDTDR